MLFELLKSQATKGKLKFKRKDKVLSIPYPRLFELAENFSRELIKKGIEKGDSVAILLENSPEWIIIDLACHRIGAIVIPIGTKLSKENIKYILKDSKTKILFSNKEVGFPSIEIVDKENWLRKLEKLKKGKLSETKVYGRDIATICYTSGTTGDTKGVILTHDNIVHNIKNQPIKSDYNDLTISYLPLSHMYERSCGYYATMYNDSTIVLLDDAKKLLDYIQEFKPTILMSVPYVLEKIHRKINEKRFVKTLNSVGLRKLMGRSLRKKMGNRLRLISCGGAPLNNEVAEFFSSMKLPIYQGYGLTELSPLVSTNYPEENRIGSVGKPIKDVEVKISDSGTLLVKSPGLMKRYTHEKEDIGNRWFDTNDLAEIRDEFIYIKGRKDNLIILPNGRNISPEKIETLLERAGIDFAFIYGNNKPHIVALLFTDKNDKEVGNIINVVNKKLPDYEKIRKFLIFNEELNVENKTLTPTLKKVRKNIEEKYKKEIEKLYLK